MRALRAACACALACGAFAWGVPGASAAPAPAPAPIDPSRLLGILQSQLALVDGQMDQQQRALEQAESDLAAAQDDRTQLLDRVRSLVVSSYEQGSPASGSIGATLLASRSVHEALSAVSLLQAQGRYVDSLAAQVRDADERASQQLGASRLAREQVAAGQLQRTALSTRIDTVQAQIAAAADRRLERRRRTAERRAARDRDAARQRLAASPLGPLGLGLAGGVGVPVGLEAGPGVGGLGASATNIQFGGGAGMEAPPTPQAAMAVSLALAQVGTPYVWGGASPDVGFDCSGLVQWSYAQTGLQLPRTTYAQIAAGVHIDDPTMLQPGDVLFFENVGHEAMYIGGGLAVQAPHTGDVVRVTPAAEMAARMGYDGAIRPALGVTTGATAGDA